MINLDKLPFTFDSMIKALSEKKNFSLSRWGDGEWMCLLGYTGKNTDKHIYYPDMGKALLKIVESGGRGELLALQSLALRDLKDNKEFQRLVKQNTWSANAEILSRNHARDKEFFWALSKRRIIMVGNVYHREVPFEYDEFIEIPLRNCWLERNEIIINLIPHKDDVVLYCASMMANVLINIMYSPDYTQIDVGSFLDPYVGRITRRYMYDLDIQ